MKKRFKLLPIALLLIIGLALSGCSGNSKTLKKQKVDNTTKLIECLNKCKEANSVAASINYNNTKMNMKLKDIKSDLKVYVDMDLEGQKQQFYLAHVDNQYKIYVENAGQYYSKTVDSTELDGIDVSNSFNEYVDVVKKYPSMFKKEGKNTFIMSPSKTKMAEIYKAITGQEITGNIDNVEVKFVIGDDGYLKEATAKAGNEEVFCEYSGFNTDLGFEIPQATELTE